VNFRAARGTPISLEAFREQIGRRGFEAAESIYADFKRDDAEFDLDEIPMIAWAEQLVDSNRLPEAIKLLSLCVIMRPESSAAHASLARVRQLMGERAAAIEGYRKALAGNRVNPDASRRLRDLERATATDHRQRDESKRL
jgi:tetratricopeptide (TPR) repeat protein